MTALSLPRWAGALILGSTTGCMVYSIGSGLGWIREYPPFMRVSTVDALLAMLISLPLSVLFLLLSFVWRVGMRRLTRGRIPRDPVGRVDPFPPAAAS